MTGGMSPWIAAIALISIVAAFWLALRFCGGTPATEIKVTEVAVPAQRRVLIADADADRRDRIAKALVDFDVIYTASTMQAEARLESEKSLSAVVVSHKLGTENYGVEFCKRVVQLRPEVVRILISDALPPDVTKGLLQAEILHAVLTSGNCSEEVADTVGRHLPKKATKQLESSDVA